MVNFNSNLSALNMNAYKQMGEVDNLKDKISNSSESTDEELMEACKSFESYLVEQMFKSMRSTVNSSEDNNPYMNYFGEDLYKEYAASAVESNELGIAKMLYDSMKKQ